MSEPPSIPYASLPPEALPHMHSPDAGYLTAICICHYVWGGLAILSGLFFTIYLVLGILALNGSFPAQPNSPPTPPALGWIFICMGSVGLLFGVAGGVLTIISGRAIAKRKWRTFSLVMAGVNCAWVPIGTVLGIFTFIVLLRPSVRSLYPAIGPA